MSSVRRLGFAALAILAVLGSAAAGAQPVFRIVGPDGRITFSDKPPVEGQAKATNAPTVVIPSAGGGGTLPFELRNVVNRYPVTLYSGQDCGPCLSGRNYLSSRGIPFTERTVSSDDDVQALIRLAGAPRLPVLTIGGQQLKGFSDSEWSQYLDAAGYPRSSQLPSGYRNPAPAPLVAVQAPRRAAQEAEPPQTDAQPAPAPAPAPANPAGIRF
jgi:glutaredoxin